MSSKLALVIANTEYQDASFAKLTAPGKDADEFAHVLREPDFGAFDDVQVLLNEEESKIRRAIARFFVNRKRDDLLLLYFSGHGVRNEQGQLFLAANDTEITILDATGIPADFITHAMNNSRSQRQLLILDCCNSGAFAHGTKSASAIGKSMGIATAFEGSGFGRVVLTATDATQFAWEGDKIIGNTQKSVFTHFLVEGLKGDADRNGDGRIHVDELYDYAYEQVVRRTPKQTPAKWSYKQQGDIVLRDNLRIRDVKPLPLPSDLLEVLEHPSSFVRSSGVQELIRLLDGGNLGLARAAEDMLREIVTSDDSLSLRKTAHDILISRGITLEKPSETTDVNTFVANSTTLDNLKSKSKKPPRGQATTSRQTFSFPDISSSLGRIFGRSGQLFKVIEKNKAIPGLDQRLFVKILGLSIGIIFLGWVGSALINNWPSFNSPGIPTLATNSDTTISSLSTASITPSPTIPDLQTSTEALTDSVAEFFELPGPTNLGVGSIMTSDKDGMTMVYVPAGEFTMGSEDYSDASPIHIYLDAFWIDQTEVTNAMYSICVSEGVCNNPKRGGSYTRDYYFRSESYDDYPVIHVSWTDARTYCQWANRRLPTEAEWEKAARGEQAYIYPWGNTPPINNLLNFNDAVGDTTAVGSYPDGASPYGALDMAGNVMEWVADYYDSQYYSVAPTANPLGPDYATARVIRGGGWDNWYPSTAGRSSLSRETTRNDLGFRCAISQTMQADSTPLAQTPTVTVTPTFTLTPTVTVTPTFTKTPTRIPVTSTSTPTP